MAVAGTQFASFRRRVVVAEVKTPNAVAEVGAVHQQATFRAPDRLFIRGLQDVELAIAYMMPPAAS